jgi:hypothetical protein
MRARPADLQRSRAAAPRVSRSVILLPYATGKPLKATGIDAKIKDAWERKDKQLADPAEADHAADWRVDKILTGEDDVSTIDAEHGAIQTRAPEKTIIDGVRAKIVAARKADLLLIHKWWPGFADQGNIYIQRIQQTDPKTGQVDKPTGRTYMWEQFQTIIHEYIHTLEHPEHVSYRKGLKPQQGGFVLREGTTDYFTKLRTTTRRSLTRYARPSRDRFMKTASRTRIRGSPRTARRRTPRRSPASSACRTYAARFFSDRPS